MKKRDIAAFFLGTILLAYIINTLEPDRITGILLKTKLEYFFLASFFYFLNEIVAAFALKMISPKGPSLFEILKSHLCGMLYSNATPGRVGYYYTSISIAKKTKTSKSGNIGLLTLYQGMNFFMKVFLCILAVIYFSSQIIDPESRRYLFFASLFPLVGLGLIAAILYTKIFNNIISRTPLLKSLEENMHRMQHAVASVKKQDLLKLMMYSFFGWILTATQWYFIAVSLGLGIDYIAALMFQPLISTVMFVPVSPSGLGIAEGGSALLFSAVGFLAADGVAFMLLMRANTVLVDVIGILDMKPAKVSLHEDQTTLHQ